MGAARLGSEGEGTHPLFLERGGGSDGDGGRRRGRAEACRLLSVPKSILGTGADSEFAASAACVNGLLMPGTVKLNEKTIAKQTESERERRATEQAEAQVDNGLESRPARRKEHAHQHRAADPPAPAGRARGGSFSAGLARPVYGVSPPSRSVRTHLPWCRCPPRFDRYFSLPQRRTRDPLLL